ncbi:MAG: aminotransferase class V-fold PLP-dependent enzyme [Phycisphaerales bacterium]|nr:aminotransferase class V-fold PLP-dependent enzyme [Phycisphaerales bacterium]
MSAREMLPAPSPLARHWKLDPGIAYLNHGSFGACPIPVLEAQARYRDRMEAEAIRYFVIDFDDLMDAARRDLAAFVNCPASDLAFVTNATIGVATVFDNEARLGRVKEGDQVIASPHEYPACLNNLRRICARVKAEIVMAEIPFPLSSPDQVVDAILAKVTDRTRLALVSHVTSPSGLVLPIQTIVDELKRRKVETVVDGAHAPGFTDLDLEKLAPAYYTANCHKWVCSPKGSALLYVRPDLQVDFRPVVLSNFAEKPKPGRSQFLTEFDYIGTSDHTAFLAISDALRFMGTLLTSANGRATGGLSASAVPTIRATGGSPASAVPAGRATGGLPASAPASMSPAAISPATIAAGYAAIRAHNRALVLRARDLVCRTLGVEPPAPDSMIGCLTSIFLPKHDEARHARLMARPSKYHDALQNALVEKHGIQVPVWSVAGRPDRLIRLSAQVYNSFEQYEYLARALKTEMEIERSL